MIEQIFKWNLRGSLEMKLPYFFFKLMNVFCMVQITSSPGDGAIRSILSDSAFFNSFFLSCLNVFLPVEDGTK